MTPRPARQSRRSQTEALATFSELAGVPFDADRLAALAPEVMSLLAAVRGIWEEDHAQDLDAPAGRVPDSGGDTIDRPADADELMEVTSHLLSELTNQIQLSFPGSPAGGGMRWTWWTARSTSAGSSPSTDGATRSWVCSASAGPDS